MAWWSLIPMAVGALQGANAAERKADQQRSHNLAQAEITRYSPWTKMQGQLDNSYTPSSMDGAFAGGVRGLGMAQSLNNAWGSMGTPEVPQVQDTQALQANTAFRSAQKPTFFG